MLFPLWGSILALLYFAPHQKNLIGYLGAITILAMIPALIMGIMMGEHMDEGMEFKQALLHTVYTTCAVLAFLPLVGGFFQRIVDGGGEKYKNPFTQPDSHDE